MMRPFVATCIYYLKMNFVDEASITVQAGKGGDGCVSFRRERCIPHGGPDGGDGGDGGSVYLVGDEGLNTLADFRHQPRFKASDGIRGQGSNRRGKQGDDLLVRVPTGTAVYHRETGELIDDVLEHQKNYSLPTVADMVWETRVSNHPPIAPQDNSHTVRQVNVANFVWN